MPTLPALLTCRGWTDPPGLWTEETGMRSRPPEPLRGEGQLGLAQGGHRPPPDARSFSTLAALGMNWDTRRARQWETLPIWHRHTRPGAPRPHDPSPLYLFLSHFPDWGGQSPAFMSRGKELRKWDWRCKQFYLQMRSRQRVPSCPLWATEVHFRQSFRGSKIRRAKAREKVALEAAGKGRGR